jgi:hypothetical protein
VEKNKIDFESHLVSLVMLMEVKNSSQSLLEDQRCPDAFKNQSPSNVASIIGAIRRHG